MNPKIIAEIGCNHKGSMKIAKEMINTASIFCKADCVKFQKRNPRELLSKVEYNSPHPNMNNSYGETYGEHRDALELDLDQHRQLKKWCDKMNIMYSCSVWDLTSTKEIVSLQPKLIKISSACNLHKDILEYLCEYYKGEIHISFGMTSQKEEKKIVDFFKERKRNTDLVIYSCTSGYPVPFEDVCLLEIKRLLRDYSQDVKAVGFSGHHLGIAVDVAAITLGARWVERHFTLDRTWKGTDHAASLEPDGIRRIVRNAKAVSQALTYKREEILDIEKVQREKLKKGQIKWAE